MRGRMEAVRRELLWRDRRLEEGPEVLRLRQVQRGARPVRSRHGHRGNTGMSRAGTSRNGINQTRDQNRDPLLRTGPTESSVLRRFPGRSHGPFRIREMSRALSRRQRDREQNPGPHLRSRGQGRRAGPPLTSVRRGPNRFRGPHRSANITLRLRSDRSRNMSQGPLLNPTRGKKAGPCRNMRLVEGKCMLSSVPLRSVRRVLPVHIRRSPNRSRRDART